MGAYYEEPRNPGVDTCQPVLPAITDHLNEVCWAVDELDGRIGRLLEKLEPVTRPIPEVESGIGTPTQCSVSHTLVLLMTRIRDAAGLVDRLADSVDL